MGVKKLDFIVIGAQKAGTTSLYKYLQPHPKIYMPPEKEAPFFSSDDLYELGWEWYVREFFEGAPEDKLWGKVTPQYMSDSRVPPRIYATMPNVKLIALLRNPVDRAFSHYRMTVRRGLDKRTFDDAVDELLRDEMLEYARSLPAGLENESKCYLVWGEFGRILGNYLQLFPKEQILVVFSDDLEQRPKEVLGTVLRFLGLGADFTPPNLGKRYHVGGTRKRLPVEVFKKVGLLRRMWKIIPEKHRRRFLYWFEQWNTLPDKQPRMLPETRQRLVEFYRDDVKRLRQMLGIEVPWKEFV